MINILFVPGEVAYIRIREDSSEGGGGGSEGGRGGGEFDRERVGGRGGSDYRDRSVVSFKKIVKIYSISFSSLSFSRGYKSRSRSPVGRGKGGRGSPVYTDFRPRAVSRSRSRSYNY